MDLSDLKIKKLVIFSQKKIYLAFWETNPPPPKKKFFIFQEKEDFRKQNFLRKYSSPKLKNLIFQERTCKT